HLVVKMPTFPTLHAPAGRHDAPTELYPYFLRLNYKYFASTSLITHRFAATLGRRKDRAVTLTLGPKTVHNCAVNPDGAILLGMRTVHMPNDRQDDGKSSVDGIFWCLSSGVHREFLSSSLTRMR